MSLSRDAALEQLDAITGASYEGPYQEIPRLDAVIRRLAPAGSHYLAAADEADLAISKERVFRLRSIAQMLRADYEDGYLADIEERVHAEVFADFLDMADYLLEEVRRTPAAVVAGGRI